MCGCGFDYGTDIAPIREMYSNTSANLAQAYRYWFYLPLPENTISANPTIFWKLKCFIQASGDNHFSDAALAEYLVAIAETDAIHASCDDCRTTTCIEIEHDNWDNRPKLAIPC